MRKSILLIALLAGPCLFFSACAENTLSHQVEDLVVTLSTQPDPPKVGDVTLRAKVADARGEVVKDAAVDFSYFVFRDYEPQGYVKNVLAKLEGDLYTATAKFDTAEDWKVVVRIKRQGKAPVTASFKIAVQKW